jgi:hypothetical protein
MVPTALRAPTLDRIAGNWTGAVAVDLPMGPLRFDERMARVHAGLTRKTAPAEAPVAAAVIAMTRWLPAALRPRLARKMYSSTHFNTIVSFMPGARGPRTLAGARVRAIYPVLPLAPGVPLTVGAVVADQSLSIGILLDPALGIDRTEVQDATRQAFTRAGAGG